MNPMITCTYQLNIDHWRYNWCN